MVRSVAVMSMVLGSIVACSDPARAAIPVKIVPVHISLSAIQEPASSQPDITSSTPSKPPKGGAVNLNTATVAELEELPGIGPSMAARIIEYRQKNGGFKKVEDLMNIRGIGEKSFLKLKPQLTVTPLKADRGTGA
jgi:competence protein ComEA